MFGNLTQLSVSKSHLCWRGDDDRLGAGCSYYVLNLRCVSSIPRAEETSYEEMEWDESDFPEEPDIPDHEWAMMEMEDQMREMQHESRIATMSSQPS